LKDYLQKAKDNQETINEEKKVTKTPTNFKLSIFTNNHALIKKKIPVESN